MSALATQIGGDHYKGVAIQHFTFCQTNGISWGLACVLKYCIRHRKKNGFQDLQKAMHYLQLFIEHHSGAEYAQHMAKLVQTRPVRYGGRSSNCVKASQGITASQFCLANGYTGRLEELVGLICELDYRDYCEIGGMWAVMDLTYWCLRDLIQEEYPDEYKGMFG